MNAPEPAAPLDEIDGKRHAAMRRLARARLRRDAPVTVLWEWIVACDVGYLKTQRYFEPFLPPLA